MPKIVLFATTDLHGNKTNVAINADQVSHLVPSTSDDTKTVIHVGSPPKAITVDLPFNNAASRLNGGP